MAISSSLKLSRREKIFFLDTIGSLVGAGIPLIKSLQLLYFQATEKNIQKLCLESKARIESGESLANISRSLPSIFGGFDSAMFEMGDATGKIGQIFATLTEKEEKSLEIERKVMGALVYPIAVISVAILMVIGLLIFVIPRIEAIYREAHTALPPLTRGVIALSHFLQSYVLILAGGIVLLIVGLKFLSKQPAYRIMLEWAMLRLPVFGQLIRLRILVSFADFLSHLLTSGITIHRALDIVREGLGNLTYSNHIADIATEVRNGTHLSGSMGGEYLEKKLSGAPLTESDVAAKSRLEAFGVELITSIKVGEQTGNLSTMLAKSALRSNREIDTIVKNMSSLLEPVIIILVGGIVGIIILAIMMPFFNMAKVIG
jgi:type IV pilus assembly protein PilC